MATLTSTLRGSASLTVAPTQNTAPVLEFRCLYTRDLHKKAKKWHDGSLRFHTFNRRVMVYDDAKNYIGDLHYRQEEDFGEGVEINLDRGVMVEVGERLGETHTDLAPILERPRPENSVPQARQTPSLATSRLMSTGPSQRPKSLLEVLGPSQGRQARSRLQIQSPYEQRQTFSRIVTAEPPPKRARLFGAPEPRPEAVETPTRPGRPRLPHPPFPNKPVAPFSRAETAPIAFEDVLVLSSNEEPRKRRLKAARLAAIPGNRRNTGPGERATHSPPQASTLAPIRNTAGGSTHKTGSTRKSPQRAEIPAPVNSARPRTSMPRKARLLLGQPKPRPTLRCLLPPPLMEAPIACLSPGGSSVHSSPSSRREAVCSPDKASGLEREGASPSTHVPGSVLARDGISTRDSSPLFIPEEANRSQLGSPIQSPAREELPLSGFERTQESPRLLSTPDRPPALAANTISCSGETNSVHTSPSNRHHSEDRLTPAAEPVAGDSSRQFRRVFSENDAPQPDDHVPVQGIMALEQRSPLQVLENLTSRRVPTKSKSPAKLQRWASDNALGELDNSKMPGLEEAESKGETGPWTAEEAFLLFDWWPAELERPAFWPTGEEERMPCGIPAAGVGIRAGITTARQFLRDDVNVL